jgi:hypothetical protein
MIRRILMGAALALVAGIFAPVNAQAPAGFLDDYIAHVKPEKRMQYDALVKKMVAANRANKGDNWIAMEVVYGEMNTLRFVSMRENFAGIETAQGVFMSALVKSLTMPGVEKLFSDLSSDSTGSQGVIRVRRWDLSIGAPADAAAEAKVIGATRWIRTFVVHVRPGMGPRYEALAKMVKASVEKAVPGALSWISQSIAGDQGIVYYISQLRPSLAAFDAPGPSMREMMGDAGFAAYQKELSEIVTRTDALIYSIRPELSNPPDAVVAVAPAYWHPAPPPPPKPKTNPPAK